MDAFRKPARFQAIERALKSLNYVAAGPPDVDEVNG
jgi:hypothetical protein